jgi:hypothetical protein
MLKRLLSGLLPTLAVFTFSAIAHDTGIISGNFRDASGAVVAGTEMTIVNTATNVADHSRPNAESIYRVLSTLPRNWIYNLYVEDDRRVSSRLAANLGLRREAESNKNNKYGNQGRLRRGWMV